MLIDEKRLSKILADNPGVDGDLLVAALKEAKEVEGDTQKMVNFDLRLPYSSDAYRFSAQNAWKTAN